MHLQFLLVMLMVMGLSVVAAAAASAEAAGNELLKLICGMHVIDVVEQSIEHARRPSCRIANSPASIAPTSWFDGWLVDCLVYWLVGAKWLPHNLRACGVSVCRQVVGMRWQRQLPHVVGM